MNNHHIYSESFYKSRNTDTKKSAEIILELLFRFFHPKSMVDFGCGVGTWLYVGKNLGVQEILGIEGDWLDIKHLVINKESFTHKDLSKKIDLKRKFELAISLEVAEHIDASYADIFVENLTVSSDVILFSAAIPGQRGSGHINEQWPEYWIQKFIENGFEPLDIVRPKIWQIEEVKTWYRQNTILFVKKEKLEELPELKSFLDPFKSNWSVVHPGTFLRQIEISHPRYSTLTKLLKSFPVVLFKSLKSKYRKLGQFN